MAETCEQGGGGEMTEAAWARSGRALRPWEGRWLFPGAVGRPLGAFEQDSDKVSVLFKKIILRKEWPVRVREDAGTPLRRPLQESFWDVSVSLTRVWQWRWQKWSDSDSVLRVEPTGSADGQRAAEGALKVVA